MSERTQFPRAGARESFGVLLRALWRRPILLVAALLALVAGAVVSLVVPLAIGWIVDALAAGDVSGVLAGAVATLATAAVVRGAITASAAALLLRITEPALAELREGAVESVLAMPTSTVESAGTGDVLARVTGDIERLSDAAGGTLQAFVSSGLGIAVTIGGLAALDWRFALAGLAAVPIQAATLRWYLRTSAPVYRDARTAESTRSQRLFETISGLATIRAFGLHGRERDRVHEASGAAVALEQRAVRLSTRFYGRLNVAEFVGLAAILAVGYLLVRDGSVSLGAATTAALFFVALFDPVNAVLGLFDTVQQAGASLTRIVGLTRAPRPAPGSRRHAVTDGSVELSAVRAGYSDGGAEVLHGVSLSIDAGSRVAIVGTTGAGKSTLARVIAGGLVATQGSVRIGGVDVAELRGPALRDSVTLLDQRTHAFAGAIRDDLLLARPAASDAELNGALERAGAGRLLASLPDGLASRIGAGGRLLTAAEAQHLALARLILRSPVVAILDEASADAGSAAAVALEDATDRILEGRTGIVIAHRLTQAARADRVIVLAAGVVVEDGTHDGLVAAGGHYAALWSAWSDARIPRY